MHIHLQCRASPQRAPKHSPSAAADVTSMLAMFLCFTDGIEACTMMLSSGSSSSRAMHQCHLWREALGCRLGLICHVPRLTKRLSVRHCSSGHRIPDEPLDTDFSKQQKPCVKKTLFRPALPIHQGILCWGAEYLRLKLVFVMGSSSSHIPEIHTQWLSIDLVGRNPLNRDRLQLCNRRSRWLPTPGHLHRAPA